MIHLGWMIPAGLIGAVIGVGLLILIQSSAERERREPRP